MDRGDITLEETVLRNLIIERELAISKILFTTQRLEKLEEQIAEQRKKVESETEEKA